MNTRMIDIAKMFHMIGDLLAEEAVSEDEPVSTEKNEVIPETKVIPETEAVDVVIPKFEDIRALLTGIAQSGKTAEVKALLSKYGAARLSDIPQQKYASLFADAEAIKNA